MRWWQLYDSVTKKPIGKPIQAASGFQAAKKMKKKYLRIDLERVYAKPL